MARKPPVSYSSLNDQPDAAPDIKPVSQPIIRTVGQGARTLKEVSAHIMTYIHPDAAKALKRYAVENNCKVHDLCLEAFEDHPFQGLFHLRFTKEIEGILG